MRTPLIAGNWKMNTTLADAHLLASGVRSEAEHIGHIEIVMCPPSIWLTDIAHHVVAPKQFKHLKLGAQNMYYEESGTFTGEISPLMVKEVAEYVILGHSDRTHIFGEKPELINHKLRAAFDHGLTPILCIGEDERTSQSKRHLAHELDFLVRDLTEAEIDHLVVAYEPVWAISNGNVAAGHPATPEYGQEVIGLLRERVTPKTRILYGGSSSPENIASYMEQPDIDGVLSGGASLKLKSFATMCQIAEDLATAHK